MNETIRDRIKRRVRWCMAVAVLGWLIFPLTAATNGDGKPLPIFIILGAGLVVAAILALQWAIKCPRCSRTLGQDIGMRIGLAVFREPPNFCPYCGVSLDEPCSPAASQLRDQTLNPIK